MAVKKIANPEYKEKEAQLKTAKTTFSKRFARLKAAQKALELAEMELSETGDAIQELQSSLADLPEYIEAG